MTPNNIPRGTVARYADGLLTLTTPDGRQWRWAVDCYIELEQNEAMPIAGTL